MLSDIRAVIICKMENRKQYSCEVTTTAIVEARFVPPSVIRSRYPYVFFPSVVTHIHDGRKAGVRVQNYTHVSLYHNGVK